MNSAMEKSCNTYFIVLGQKVGSEKLISLCSDFGLGKDLEIADNFYGKSGILPSTETINSPQSLANLSFGQGNLLSSPLQMAVAYSCIANGGYYRPPTLMKAIIDNNGMVIQKVKLPQSYRILNTGTVKNLDTILKNVVATGNGEMAYSETTENHGKTATAQSGWYENGREITHTWFCGYFSYNDITYTVVIFKDDGYSGAIDCAPAFKYISEKITDIKQLQNE
jgi:cell division protein FtsI/penicillin-binding protein 2